jgi:hypothetical protein
MTYDLRKLQAIPLSADRLWPRPGGFLCLGCVGGEHGEDCWGRSCPCKCRAMLGIDGPFPGRDPTAPDATDGLVA